MWILNFMLINIIYYIIKVGFRSHGCTKWLHQIVEILLDLIRRRRYIERERDIYIYIYIYIYLYIYSLSLSSFSIIFKLIKILI